MSTVVVCNPCQHPKESGFFPYIFTNFRQYLLFSTIAALSPHYIRKGGIPHDRLQSTLEHLKIKAHQPVSPGPQLSFQLRPASADPEEWAYLHSYSGNSVQDLKLQCRRHRTHLILSPARKRFKNGWSLSESFSGKDQRPWTCFSLFSSSKETSITSSILQSKILQSVSSVCVETYVFFFRRLIWPELKPNSLISRYWLIFLFSMVSHRRL